MYKSQKLQDLHHKKFKCLENEKASIGTARCHYLMMHQIHFNDAIELWHKMKPGIELEKKGKKNNNKITHDPNPPSEFSRKASPPRSYSKEP